MDDADRELVAVPLVLCLERALPELGEHGACGCNRLLQVRSAHEDLGLLRRDRALATVEEWASLGLR